MNNRIRICKLGLGMTTDQGPYWAKVDGVNVGEHGRSHWQTHSEAYACAARFIKLESAAEPEHPHSLGLPLLNPGQAEAPGATSPSAPGMASTVRADANPSEAKEGR